MFLFGRLAGAPSDRNLVDLYVDGGVSFNGMVPGRPDDQFGFLGSFSRISRAARAADIDANFYNATFAPVRNFEALLEATYAINVTNGVVVQPNIQYVFHPGGNVANPLDPLRRPIPNAFVVGLRTTIQY